MIKLFNILTILMLLVACSTRKADAPVISRVQPPSSKVLTHVVAPNETLYSIAWRYNLDFKGLASVNNVDNTFNIFPGQILHLSDRYSVPLTTADKSQTPIKPHKVINQQSAQSLSPIKPSIVSTVAPKPTTRVMTSPKPIKSSRLTNPSGIKKVPKPTSKVNTKLTWVWPVLGPIIDGFQSNKGLNKGIDIGGKLGEPIKAASAGVIVYAGEGLRGYGRLIIIKHSEKYLSAYAHNDSILVKEGQYVKQNEVISTMGKSGTTRAKLHFEIRFDGKPVNPTFYLPKNK